MIIEVKQHRVKHGDVMQLAVPNNLLPNEKAHIFYSDPPWGKGNIAYWQTMNVKMNEGVQRSDIEYNAFVKQIFNLAAVYTKDDGIVFIEYGCKWADDIINMAKTYGLLHIATAKPLYRSGSKLLPLDLHIFSKRPITLENGYLDAICDTYGLDTLRQAVRPFVKPLEIIFDPCCGMGYCAQIAIENNMAFRGNELNRARLQKTINRLEKATK